MNLSMKCPLFRNSVYNIITIIFFQLQNHVNINFHIRIFPMINIIDIEIFQYSIVSIISRIPVPDKVFQRYLILFPPVYLSSE